jgi:Cys-rich repeat protein
MIALPASAFAVGSVNLDGSVAVAYLVDANGNPLAYSSSGTLTLSAAPGAVGGLVIGSFTGSFAVIPAGCQTDADCGRGALCQSGNCVPADCTSLGCPAGMVCDPASLACVPAGCQTDADCGAGLVCRNGSCEVAGCQVTGCPAGYTCDPTSGACFAQPACTTNSDCAAGQQCLRGQCVPGGCTGGTLCNGACVDVSTDPYNCGACGVACPRGTACIAGACAYNQGCTVTGCPAGMACDATTGQCVAQPGCVTDADCGRGLFCVSGQCVSSGSCVQYGCPAGYNCDYASGACIPGTPVGSCYFMGTGSFAGNGGGVPMCSAAGLNAVNGGPDAAIFDSQDENGNPAILLAIGDMQGSGDTYLLAVLSACPAAGSVLTGADAQFFLMYQSVTADTAIQVQKTATSGTATFTAGANGALNVSVSAQFGTNTVTGTASVSVGTP